MTAHKSAKELADVFLKEQEASALRCCGDCTASWTNTGYFQAKNAFEKGYDAGMKRAAEITNEFMRIEEASPALDSLHCEKTLDKLEDAILSELTRSETKEEV